MKLLEPGSGRVGDLLKAPPGDPQRTESGEVTMDEAKVLEWRIHGAFSLLQGGADQNVGGLVAECGFAQLLFGYMRSEIKTRDSAKAQQGESEQKSELVMVPFRGTENESLGGATAR